MSEPGANPVEGPLPSLGGRALFLGWLVVALVLSALALARELRGRDLGEELAASLTLTEDERVARELARTERENGWREGRDEAVLEAVLARVPSDGTVYVVGQRAPRQAVTFSLLQVLVYPRRLHELPEVPPREATSGLSGKDFVLELDQPPSPRLAGWFTEVAAGEGFRLWRHPETGP